MVKVTRRFSIPGVQYDYVTVEAEGDNPLEILRDIYRAYYLELAMISNMKGNDADLKKILDKIDDSVINIKSYVDYQYNPDIDMDKVEELPWD